MVRLAVFGDLHGAFALHDVDMLRRRAVDGVVLLGDLSGRTQAAPPAWLRSLRDAGCPVWWTPGNHDAVGWSAMMAELSGSALEDGAAASLSAALDAWEAELGPGSLLAWRGVALGEGWLVGGRPLSYGGPRMGYARLLAARWGVSDLARSATALRSAIADAPDPRAPLVVVAHQGPAGLGSDRAAIFGRDFHPDEGDWGDTDLADALADVEEARPVVVLAGHMHHALRGGGRRTTVWQRGERVVVNAARVPRVGRDGVRHHVEVVLDVHGATVAEVACGDGVDRVRVLGAVGADAGEGAEACRRRARVAQGGVLDWPGVP
jgi:uncharacterized protein (TIGR04168 family)